MATITDGQKTAAIVTDLIAGSDRDLYDKGNDCYIVEDVDECIRELLSFMENSAGKSDYAIVDYTAGAPAEDIAERIKSSRNVA